MAKDQTAALDELRAAARKGAEVPVQTGGRTFMVGAEKLHGRWYAVVKQHASDPGIKLSLAGEPPDYQPTGG